MRRLTPRVAIMVAALAVASMVLPLLTPMAPAEATTGSTVCNRYGQIKRSCLRLSAAGTYVSVAHMYVKNGGVVKGHWQWRYPVYGSDVYTNSSDIVWHPDANYNTARYDRTINRWVDPNTYFCARFWRNYAQGRWDLPFGDWNCVLVTP
jgi:hypothetical protein